jgi:hypothetical protein
MVDFMYYGKRGLHWLRNIGIMIRLKIIWDKLKNSFFRWERMFDNFKKLDILSFSLNKNSMIFQNKAG